MKYEDRFAGKCLVYIDRNGLLGKIMYIMETNTYNLVVGENIVNFTSFQEAFDLLVVL